MTATPRLVASLFAGIVLAALTAVPVGAAGAPPATLELTPDIAPTGTRVTIEIDGWTGAPNVVAELCGNAPDPGSSDCDLGGSEGGNVPEGGSALLDLVIGTPPAPCPCIVRVHAADGRGPVASAPIVITDLAPRPQVEAPTVLVTSRVVVDQVELGAGGAASWFGLPHDRTLTFRVRNTGSTPIDRPQVSLRAIDGSPQLVVPPEIPALEPGEAVTVTVEVPVGLFATGILGVDGRILGVDDAAPFDASAPLQPVGLLVVVVGAVALGVVVVVRRRLRRRRAGPEDDQASPMA